MNARELTAVSSGVRFEGLEPRLLLDAGDGLADGAVWMEWQGQQVAVVLDQGIDYEHCR